MCNNVGPLIQKLAFLYIDQTRRINPGSEFVFCFFPPLAGSWCEAD